uniref:FAD-binding PCMH-type domain-containing protein n=1 Tax=Clytia hemisphaerica TaxID=252671 RepID=A0A7M5XKH2_9CNID
MNLRSSSIIASLVVLVIQLELIQGYCTPKNKYCWPSENVWQRRLGSCLDGNLHKFNPTVLLRCQNINSSMVLGESANGACMQIPECSKRFCLADQPSNLPSYSVEAKTTRDVVRAFKFANRFNIAVTVKTTGHSFSGSSFGRDTLMIWMRNFQKFGDISTTFEDSCHVKYPASIKIGGGQIWSEIYSKIAGTEYNIMGALAPVVSAAGGWLQGSGLSPLSRQHGLGVDNVISFKVVQPNGCVVTADACRNKDLFWALRGGGGGTFGVVVSTQYRLLPKKPITFLALGLSPIQIPFEQYLRIVHRFMDFWTVKSAILDNRWGGLWNGTSLALFFEGDRKEAEATLINDLFAWRSQFNEAFHQNIFTLLQDFPGVSEASIALAQFFQLDNTAIASSTKDIGNRLIPKKWIKENPQAAAGILKRLFKETLQTGKFVSSYILGGAVSNVLIRRRQSK